MNLHQLQLEMLENIYTGSLNQKQAIYSNNTKIALANHLQTIYIVCHKMVGTFFFKKACLDYIQQHYLTEYDLTFYGEFFSENLTNIIDHKLPKNYIKNEGLNCLPDLAKWEWAIHQALCGPNYLNLFNHADVLTDANFKNRQVVFPPGCALLKSSYPLEKIWRAHQTNEINQRDFILNIECGEYYWWIGLVESELLIQPLSKSAWLFLNEVKNKGLMPVLEQASETNQYATLIDILVDLLRKGQLILL